MSGFSADWLALREPHDRAARAASAITHAVPGLASRLRQRAVPGDSVSGDQTVLNVIDLACGSGANLRELAPRLGGRQRWRLIDHDADLLRAVPAALEAWASRQGHRLHAPGDGSLVLNGEGFEAVIERQALDLANHLEQVPWRAAHLVTASALLDLVSVPWIDRLVDRAVGAGAAMLFTLSVDGRHAWTPTDVDDEAMHRTFAEHQRRDKGFGPALGGEAAGCFLARAARAGCQVASSRSDWCIGRGPEPVAEDAAGSDPAASRDRALLQALIDGMATAVSEQRPGEAARARAWAARRHALIGQTGLQVGHLDVLAEPAGRVAAGG